MRKPELLLMPTSGGVEPREKLFLALISKGGVQGLVREMPPSLSKEKLPPKTDQTSSCLH